MTPILKISSHAMSLALALVLSYWSILQEGENFRLSAYNAAVADDLPGIGDAAFEFKLTVILLPMGGAVIYTLSRLMLWRASQSIRRWRARGHTASF